jgi:hypothetical protein
MKRAFAVGRCDRRTRQVLILKYLKSPIIGPFALHAVVTRSH